MKDITLLADKQGIIAAQEFCRIYGLRPELLGPLKLSFLAGTVFGLDQAEKILKK